MHPTLDRYLLGPSHGKMGSCTEQRSQTRQAPKIYSPRQMLIKEQGGVLPERLQQSLLTGFVSSARSDRLSNVPR
jgi:hypothetical protein